MKFTTGEDTIRTIKTKTEFMQKVLNAKESLVWKEEHQIKKENAELFLKEMFELEIIGKDLHLVRTRDAFYKAINEAFYGSVELGGRFCLLGFIATEDHKEMWIGYIAPVSAI